MWLSDSSQLLFPVAGLAAHLLTVNIYRGWTPKSTGAFSARLCPLVRPPLSDGRDAGRYPQPGTTENPKEASPTHAASKKMLLFALSHSVGNESPRRFHWGLPASKETFAICIRIWLERK